MPIHNAMSNVIINSGAVADTVCLSLIPDPDFCPYPDHRSRIPDPKTAAKEKDEKKLVVLTFFVATNITTLKMI